MTIKKAKFKRKIQNNLYLQYIYKKKSPKKTSAPHLSIFTSINSKLETEQRRQKGSAPKLFGKHASVGDFMGRAVRLFLRIIRREPNKRADKGYRCHRLDLACLEGGSDPLFFG